MRRPVLSSPARGASARRVGRRAECRTWWDESGVTSLSVVLVVPAVLLLTSAVAQMVVYYHASNLATAAAQEASRTAQLLTGTADAGRAAGQDFLAQATAPTSCSTPKSTSSEDRTRSPQK